MYIAFLFLEGIGIKMSTLEIKWALGKTVKCLVSAFSVFVLNNQNT